MKDFFVSYNGTDRQWAEWISWELEDAGYSVVLQAWDFSGNWVLAMDRAMKETARTVAVLSPNYLNALYTHPEWAEAFRRDPKGERDLLVPVRIQDVELSGILAALSYVDFVAIDEALARDRLLKRVRGERGKPSARPIFPGTGSAEVRTPRPAFPGEPAPRLGNLMGVSSPLPGLYHSPGSDWQSPVGMNPHRYKVVVFDLDGTLVRGNDFTFSWERIWTKLNFAKGVRQELRSAYRLRAETSEAERIAAYRAWCQEAANRFRTRGLTRSRLQAIAADLSLTINCREALTTLRKAGFVTAIVSGGVHTFLDDVFPDFRTYFDFAFINELTFDANGVVSGVNATAYDFEGKANALAEVCSRSGCGLDESVFVGDQFNDETIMLKAGLAIAYPPGDTVVSDSAHVAITDDDLTSILSHVIVS
jgi:HAD superfamily phosphoserine phosphatase-like hydrolase